MPSRTIPQPDRNRQAPANNWRSFSARQQRGDSFEQAAISHITKTYICKETPWGWRAYSRELQELIKHSNGPLERFLREQPDSIIAGRLTFFCDFKTVVSDTQNYSVSGRELFLFRRMGLEFKLPIVLVFPPASDAGGLRAQLVDRLHVITKVEDRDRLKQCNGSQQGFGLISKSTVPPLEHIFDEFLDRKPQHQLDTSNSAFDSDLISGLYGLRGRHVA